MIGRSVAAAPGAGVDAVVAGQRGSGPMARAYCDRVVDADGIGVFGGTIGRGGGGHTSSSGFEQALDPQLSTARQRHTRCRTSLTIVAVSGSIRWNHDGARLPIDSSGCAGEPPAECWFSPTGSVKEVLSRRASIIADDLPLAMASGTSMVKRYAPYLSWGAARRSKTQCVTVHYHFRWQGKLQRPRAASATVSRSACG